MCIFCTECQTQEIRKQRAAENQKTADNCRKLQSRPGKLADTFWNQAEPQASLLQEKLEQLESICLSDALLDVIEVGSKQGGRPHDPIWSLAFDRSGKPPVTAVFLQESARTLSACISMPTESGAGSWQCSQLHPHGNPSRIHPSPCS